MREKSASEAIIVASALAAKLEKEEKQEDKPKEKKSNKKKEQKVEANNVQTEKPTEQKPVEQATKNDVLEKALEFVKNKQNGFVAFCTRYNIDYKNDYNNAVIRYYQAYLRSLKQAQAPKKDN